ncbi:MAG TPA: FtsX-like permease family protein, partial [Candidatus Thermoplasmatota archaeon]|nr:FtsX-like permease family protein [Candidatus Thermoplasmatota archaeon]
IGRGGRNAFRNGGRTMGVTLILGLAIALALCMLLAHGAVQGRIDAVTSDAVTAIQVSPADTGFGGGPDTSQPLSQSNLTTILATPHVAKAVQVLTVRMDAAQTSLKAPAFTGGPGGGGRGGQGRFNPPLTAIGASDLTVSQALGGGTFTLTSGALFDPAGADRVALVGKGVADNNSLAPGSTFTAFGAPITVAGVFDAGNQFTNRAVLFPIQMLQAIANRTGEVSQVLVYADSAANVPMVVTALQTGLGGAARVINPEDRIAAALAPLQTVADISLYSLLGAVGAAAAILLLAMVLVVRERRREIGVLKSLGAANGRVVLQFVAESVTLTALATAFGALVGLWASDAVLRALVSTNSGTAGAGRGGFGGGGFGGGGGIGGLAQATALTTHADPMLLILGLGAVLAIAVLGSTVPAYLISKVRPAETLRGE